MKFGKIANLEARKKITSILLVDDEEPNLRQLSEVLNDNYTVIKALSAKEAIEILNNNLDVSIIISDQRMPEMTGTELFEYLENQRHPAMRIILTGFADMKNVHYYAFDASDTSIQYFNELGFDKERFYVSRQIDEVILSKKYDFIFFVTRELTLSSTFAGRKF